jgi:hypothetical protein
VPEFILPHGTEANERKFNDMDPFIRGYIEAMFFTNTGNLEDGDLQDATTADLAQATLLAIIIDCADFQHKAERFLKKVYASPKGYDPVQAGRDFWFTRCGHGVGFWDRGLGTPGDDLSEIARAFGNVDMVRGDDGKVYVE